MTVHVHDKEEALFSFEKTKEEADLKKFSLFKNKERASQQWRTTLGPVSKFFLKNKVFILKLLKVK